MLQYVPHHSELRTKDAVAFVYRAVSLIFKMLASSSTKKGAKHYAGRSSRTNNNEETKKNGESDRAVSKNKGSTAEMTNSAEALD